MADKTSKIVSWVLYGLMAVSVLLGILFYTGSVDSGTLIQWGYVLTIVTVLIAIASPVYGFIQSPGNLIKIVISVGLVAVIGIISYVLAGNTFSATKLEILNITAQTSKIVGMGLLFTYITAVIAILAVLFSSVYKIFK